MLTPIWMEILEISQRCPSPHNVQPWLVRIDSDTACTVFLDNSRTLPKEDPSGSFIASGMTMYLETMRLAAETLQYRLEYQLLPTPPVAAEGVVPFAAVTMSRDPALVPAYDKTLLLQRRTSRLGHLPQPVAAEIQAELIKLGQTFSQTYNHTESKQLIDAIIGQNIAALFHDLNSRNYHDEIVSWFRFNDRLARKHHDGLDARCMRIRPAEYLLSARLPIMFKIPLLNKVFAARYKTILGAANSIGWVSGKFWTPEEAALAGKFLIHFWLTLTKYGLYIHPFGNLVTNKPARAWLENAVQLPDIWFVFRIGYTDKPPESYRKDVKEILL